SRRRRRLTMPPLDAALAVKQKLLEYDRNSARRTKVIDDQMDYFESDGAVWLSDAEKSKLRQRESEIRQQRHKSRLERRLVYDFCRPGHIDPEQDDVLREIAEARTRAGQWTLRLTPGATVEINPQLKAAQPTQIQQRNQSGSSAAPSWSVEDFPLANPSIACPPQFVRHPSAAGKSGGKQQQSSSAQSSSDAKRAALRLQDADLRELRDDGHCLSMHQPWATLLVRGIKVHEGRSWYTAHRGRLWIAATARRPSDEEVAAVLSEYPAAPAPMPNSRQPIRLAACLAAFTVDDVLPQDEYREQFPQVGDGSGRERVAISCFCASNPRELLLKLPMKGEHKIYRLDKQLHKAALAGLARGGVYCQPHWVQLQGTGCSCQAPGCSCQGALVQLSGAAGAAVRGTGCSCQGQQLQGLGVQGTGAAVRALAVRAETYKLWKVRRTINQMCRDRGYLILQEECTQTLEEFKQQFGDQPCSAQKPSRSDLTMLVAHQEDPTDRMICPKLGIKHVKTYVNRMQQEGVYKAILVIQASGGMSPSAKQSLLDIQPKYTLEHFFESELMINITEHELVPRHELLTPAEKKELLDRYRFKESQLPKIQLGDPVARYLGLKKGEVVKIIRSSDTAGRYVTYRIVVWSQAKSLPASPSVAFPAARQPRPCRRRFELRNRAGLASPPRCCLCRCAVASSPLARCYCACATTSTPDSAGDSRSRVDLSRLRIRRVGLDDTCRSCAQLQPQAHGGLDDVDQLLRIDAVG
uniref:DNA-directed RNA polymerases I, II, and III subunit RPABC1 n=1 Tax=Macrostomum lignano TaxID=282301 RepID=A0A1I8FG97_9PLAT